MRSVTPKNSGTALGLLALLLPAGALAGQQLRYDVEHPGVPYSTATPTDPVARLQERVARGEVELGYEEGRGYLVSLLDALGVPVESQGLVFTRTSFQRGRISPATPRAVYFADEVYVAWVQGGDFVEIAAVDPLLGTVFYTLGQERRERPRFERQMQLCLSCHDTYGLTGGGVPELLTGSMLPDARGESVYHEGWFQTTYQTPLRRRWGGWYVTGTHGDQVHMGNVIVRDPRAAARIDFRESGNVTDLGGLVDTGPYPGDHSDIVALMVFEHQIAVQNLIIRLGYEVRNALHREATGAGAGAAAGTRATAPDTPAPAATAEVVERFAEPLVRALLFSGEAPLEGPVRGTSGFAERFAARGPRDARGRSLRELDLERRLFRHPMSHLVYSGAFDGLPGIARTYVYRRLREVLRGEDRSEPFSHLSEEDRLAVLEILRDTKPDFAGGVP